MGKKIFVHCHAGTGRTGLVIASYLYYSSVTPSTEDAVSKVQIQRPGSLKSSSQVQFVIDFGNWLDEKRGHFFPTENSSYSLMMKNNEQLIHGQDSEDYKYFPKFLGVCLKRLLALPPYTVEQFLDKWKRFNSLEHDQSVIP